VRDAIMQVSTSERRQPRLPAVGAVLASTMILAGGVVERPPAQYVLSRAKTPPLASGLVLHTQDLGAGFTNNRRFSRARTLAEAASGDSRVVRRVLATTWAGGYEAGFNGVRSVGGVSSQADIFRSTKIHSVEIAWMRDVLAATQGSLHAVPPGAPGNDRFLILGHATVLARRIPIGIYMWRQSRVLGRITLTSGLATTADLLRLANLQAGRVLSAGY
jgi:hypothetical protein